MCITGSLTDFSLSEILQFIGKGNKTGIITLQAEPVFQPTSLSVPSVHYIWTYQGCIIAAANQLDQQGLVKLIIQHEWVSDRVIIKLAQLCPPHIPLGLYLKKQGVLRAEHLKRLFYVQIVQRVSALLELHKGVFSFEQNVLLPKQEMTGLRISAENQKLFALRSANVVYSPSWNSNLAATAFCYRNSLEKSYTLRNFLQEALQKAVV